MSPTHLNGTGLALIALASAVGIVDAAIGQAWDLISSAQTGHF